MNLILVFSIITLDIQPMFDSVNRKTLIESLIIFCKTRKLVKMDRVTMAGSRAAVRVQGELSEIIHTETGIRQGDALSGVIFNLVLEDANIKILHPMIAIVSLYIIVNYQLYWQ